MFNFCTPARLFFSYNYLGARAYYFMHGDSNLCFARIKEYLIANDREQIQINPVAVLGILMKNYAIGTATLIKGIERTPWMARPDGTGGWESAELPMHGNLLVAPEQVALELGRRLRDEALAFLAGKKTIGILLSGGMDSRIVAGLVRQLQQAGDFNGDVVALTWGTLESRDVLYAQRIAQVFGWEYVQFSLSAEGLARNIELAAERGAEYSPVHLHAMEAVSKVGG